MQSPKPLLYIDKGFDDSRLDNGQPASSNCRKQAIALTIRVSMSAMTIYQQLTAGSPIRDKAFFSSNDDFRLEASHEVLGDMGNMRVLHESISG